MAIISKPFTFTVGAVIIAAQHNSNFDTIYNDYNGNMTDANISASAAIANTKLAQITTASKVSGAALTSLSSIPSGAGKIPTTNLPLSAASAYIKITNTQSSGTGGGTATSGSWAAITLNTKDIDTGSNVVSLSGNTFVLTAGTYDIDATNNFYRTDNSQTRLYNTTGSVLVLLGETVASGSSDATSTPSRLIGRFTIAAAQNLQFQYQVNSTRATIGLGTPASFGSEVYAMIKLLRVA